MRRARLCVSACVRGPEWLQKRYKLLLHCPPGYNLIHKNQETHSQRGAHRVPLRIGRDAGGLSATSLSGFPAPHPAALLTRCAALRLATRPGSCKARGLRRGFSGA